MIGRGGACSLAIVLVAWACSSNARDNAVRLAVWNYQLSSYGDSIGGRPACIGLVATLDSPKKEDPSPDVIAELNRRRVRVLSASTCTARASSVSFFLGPVAYNGLSEAIVEGTGLEGDYRYHLVLRDAQWRVQDGAMTSIY